MSKNQFQFSYELLPHWNHLSESDQTLVHQALEAMVICGSNQENIAFPSGLCAERVALNYVGANFPGLVIDTLCIVAKGELMPNEQLLSPCGGCRQVMLESENRQDTPIRVILVNQDQRTMIVHRVKDLLPFGFGK